MANTAADIQKLYIAYFNRPADPLGLDYWVNSTMSMVDIAQSFSVQKEYTNVYGAKSTADVVNTIYNNMFGHNADAAGLVYWADQINLGTMSLGKAALAILNGATGADLVAVTSKATAATQFTTDVSTAGTLAIVAYDGVNANSNAAAKAWLTTVVDDATLKAALAIDVTTTIPNIVSGNVVVGQTYTLTTGIDTITGTVGNDTINVLIDNTTSAVTTTLTTLDTVSGGAGNDVMNLNILNGAGPAGTAVTSLPTVSISGVETVNIRSAVDLTANVSSWTGLTAANVTQGTVVNLTGAATTALNVSGATGAVTLTGGSTQSVNSAGAVTLIKAAGAITVTDTAQGANNIAIDDGTNVSLTVTEKTTGANTIIVGGTTKPSGTVTIVDNEGPAASGAFTGGAITVNGGTVVSVTEVATQPLLATAGANATTTQSAVTVNGSTATTAVTVAQSAAVTAANTVIAVAAVKETGSAVFTAMTAGDTLTVGGLTFKAGTAGTTAAQTAAAFANLTAGALQGNSVLGTYSGAVSGWTSGAVSTATVLFTSTASGNPADLATSKTGVVTVPTITETQGVASVSAAGKGGIAGGAVTIADAKYGTAANSITTVALDGYGAASVSSDALATLSLANSTGKTVAVSNHTATTLGLTVNKLGAASALTLDGGAAKYSTLNVTTAVADSKLNVTGSVVTALTVAGDHAVDLSGSTFAALKTVTVSGAAGVTLVASGATVTDVNATASSGTNSFTIDATKATYEGGTGTDKVTTSAGVSKAIALGDGDDTVTLATGTSAVTATITGGTGTDTLSMTAADAATASGSAPFASKVTGFEHLNLTGAGGAAIDLTALGNYSYVVTNDNGTLTLNNMISGGTVEFKGTSTNTATTVGVTGATAGTADVLNVKLTAGAALAAGTLTAAKVETINLTATDTSSSNVGVTTHSLTLVATTATTVTVTGNANLNLTTTGNTAVSSIDASSMTGGLTVTTAGTVAETVKGGASANTLTAGTGTVADTLIGGAGADTITANAGLDTLTGGAGMDTFVIVASSNVNSYATITDASVGDTIKFTAPAASFVASAIVLAPTAVFQDFANAAVHNTGVVGAVSWFQYLGNTYVVENNVGAESSFTNGTDSIVKLTGLVDLTHTSLNTLQATLLIG